MLHNKAPSSPHISARQHTEPRYWLHVQEFLKCSDEVHEEDIFVLKTLPDPHRKKEVGHNTAGSLFTNGGDSPPALLNQRPLETVKASEMAFLISISLILAAGGP
jgi:hypothetical protein